MQTGGITRGFACLFNPGEKSSYERVYVSIRGRKFARERGGGNFAPRSRSYKTCKAFAIHRETAIFGCVHLASGWDSEFHHLVVIFRCRTIYTDVTDYANEDISPGKWKFNRVKLSRCRFIFIFEEQEKGTSHLVLFVVTTITKALNAIYSVLYK